MKINYLILGFYALLLFSCVGWPNLQAVPPSAQITSVSEIIDSSTQITKHVTSQANNAKEGVSLVRVYIGASAFGIPYDSLTLYYGELNLPSSFFCNIQHLKSQTEYTLQLIFRGIFEINGESEFEEFNVGSPRTFSTK